MPGTADIRSSFLGFKYDPGGAADYINEGFAGPHDFLRDMAGAYLPRGDGVPPINFSDVVVDSIANYSLVVPAAPFALAGMVPAHAYGSVFRY